MNLNPTLIPDYSKMKQILDDLKTSYWLVDQDFILLDVNQTFLELADTTREELIGRDVKTLVTQEEASRIEAGIMRLNLRDQVFRFEFHVYTRGKKEKIPMGFHLTANRNPKGEPVSYNVLMTDITTQKSLEAKEQELFHVKRKIRRESLETRMVGTGKLMDKVFYAILRCAEVDSPVLITGETGVGKEVAARAIHSQSPRHEKSFVAVNCGALPGNLLESELFGHVKGAFTGAVSDRPGLFREAEGGTLFLDEIGDLEKSLQVKLLRAIQENAIRPVGDDRTYPLNLRIICATNQDLKQRAEAGEFRLDLYYRISVIPIHIPPLRDRPEDIVKLARQFIRSQARGKEFTAISPEVRNLLCRYHWPGNIRELRNAVEHAMVMSREKTLMPESLPEQILEPGLTMEPEPRELPPIQRARNLKLQAEKKIISEALEKHSGNQTAAAREMGISRTTLWRKKTMYGL